MSGVVWRSSGWFLTVAVGKPGDSSGTTGQLSTQKRARPKLLCVSPVLCARRHTGFEAPQLRVSIEKKGLVHRKGAALLLLLFIYRDIEEQPNSQHPGRPALHTAGFKNRFRLAPPKNDAVFPPGWAHRRLACQWPATPAIGCGRSKNTKLLLNSELLALYLQALEADLMHKQHLEPACAQGCGKIWHNWPVIHSKVRHRGFVPVTETAATGMRAQGWADRKCAPWLDKTQLSTPKGALYYYDYV